MPARLRKKASGGWGARIRFGEGLLRDEWFHIDLPHDQEAQAIDRLGRLQAMAKRLSEIGKHAEARGVLEEAGATRGERGFHAIEQLVAEMAPELKPQRAPKTFRQVVQELCDGTLHELYPDEIKRRTPKGNETRRQQLATFFPVLGEKTFGEITRDDILEAKRLIPKDCMQSTRVIYLRELSYVLKRAVEPLGLCEHVPAVGIPSMGESEEFQLIYPDEEEHLVGFAEITIEERFLYAYLPRNGGRITESLQITWDHVDLERGIIHIAKAWTKTKRARSWDLEPDVLEAFRLRRLQIPDAHLVFVPPPGREFTVQTVWNWLRKNLKLAGLDRPGLTSALDGERQFTTHDFRASFVTIARALGMPDRWIRDRSGHESAGVLEVYDRGVRHAKLQGLSWWAPMAVALGMKGAKEHSRLGRSRPESGPKLVQSWSKAPKTSRKSMDLSFRGENAPPSSDPINTDKLALSATGLAPKEPHGPAHFSTSVHSSSSPAGPLPPAPALDSSQLTRLLALAERAKQWDLVAAVGQALDALSRTEATNVTSLADARTRRERGDR